jgi:uncharacterized repeat protein (TIGR03803 family)
MQGTSIKEIYMQQIRRRNVHTIALAAALLTILLVFSSAASAQIYSDLYNFTGSDGDSPSDPQVMAQGQDGNLYGTLPEGLGNSGVVFQMTPSGLDTVLWAFNGTDGSRPNSGLTLGLDGNFYGTTVLGGINGLGTIFQITPAGGLTTLYNFTGGSDGAYPYGTPILGNDGNFYGLTQYATAYKITPSGVFKLLGTIPDRSFSPLFLASDGNFYGTTQHGGAMNLGTVFRMTPAGVVTTIYSFDNTHGAVPWGGVVQAGDGNFYGTATIGGTGGGGVVFRVTPMGNYKVIHNFPVNSPDDGSDPIAGLVLATDGTFYGVTFSGGVYGYGVIFKLAPTGTYTLIYQFDGTTGSNSSSNLVQHTNGFVYGLALGGLRGDGVFYGLELNLGSTVRFVLSSGKVGSTVEILGGGFTGATAVKFNGKAARFTVVSDTYLTAGVPAGASSGYVKVTTPSGTSTSQTKFLVLPRILSFSPTSGSVGTSVVIRGNTFTGATRVTFGGVAATSFSVDSDSQITATVPSGARTGKIGVTTPSGTATSSGTFTVM